MKEYVGLSAQDLVRSSARTAARHDVERGRSMNALRHGAYPGSQWAEWYEEAYKQRADILGNGYKSKQ